MIDLKNGYYSQEFRSRDFFTLCEKQESMFFHLFDNHDVGIVEHQIGISLDRPDFPAIRENTIFVLTLVVKPLRGQEITNEIFQL